MAEKTYKALILGELAENTAEFRRRLSENRHPITVVEVKDFDKFRKAIQDPSLDIIIVDIEQCGLEVLDAIMENPPLRPVIIVGDVERIDLILEAKRRGLQFTITRANALQANQEMLFLESILAIEQIAEPPSMKNITLTSLKRYSQYYNIDQPFFVVDRNYRLIYFNQASFLFIKKMHGFHIKIGDDVESYYFDSSKDAFNSHIEQAFSGEKLNIEYVFPDLEQDLRQRELLYRPVFNENREVIAVSITSKDIHARLKAEQRFLDRETALWGFFDVGPLPLVVLDENLGVIHANSSFLHLLNLGDSSSLKGEGAHSFFFPEHQNSLRKKFRNLLDGEFPYFQNEHHYCKADGMGVWVHHIGFAINLGKNGDRGILIIALDITRRREAERQNQHSARINAVGELASSVAHDFNNILTVMNTLNHTLEEDLDSLSQAELVDNIQKMGQAILKGTTLTKQLLNFERGRKIDQEIIDLNQHLRDSHDLLQSALGGTIKLEVELASEPLPIQIGAGQIDQIIMNFVMNARDAMPDGGMLRINTSRLWIQSEQEAPRGGLTPGDWVMCQFIDTGVGMDNETQRLIFEPFYTTKSPGMGTGLGMATIYRILAAMHGKVYVDSEVGQGTTFTIYIPAEYISV